MALCTLTLLRVICVKGLFYRVAQKVHLVDSSPTFNLKTRRRSGTRGDTSSPVRARKNQTPLKLTPASTSAAGDQLTAEFDGDYTISDLELFDMIKETRPVPRSSRKRALSPIVD
uniref:Uncharacterized protein n=1 Tax=Plectus sambesii TaxID=2011161 RepID=A0A914X6Q3_9BILA